MVTDTSTQLFDLPDRLLPGLVGADAAWHRLPDPGVLVARGSDRVRFLNGMVSNDVAVLAAGQSCYALQLDRKGHVVAEVWVLAFEDELWLLVTDGRGPAVLELLEKHVIADDVSFEDRSRALGAVAFEGTGARRAADAPALGDGACARVGPGAWLSGGAFTPSGVRLIAPEPELRSRLAAADLPELDTEQTEVLRVAGCHPRLGIELGPRTFPAEARLERTAVSFTKGCYIGQEIVARIDSRGAVNRLLVQLRPERTVRANDDVLADGSRVGAVTSAADTPEGPLALAYVKRAHAEPGTRLVAGDVPAVVTGPPLD